MTFKAITEIIRNTALTTPNGDNEIILTETCENKTVSLTIKNVPRDLIAIKIDKYFKNDCIFQGSHDECKRSDYVLVSEKEKKCMFFELKKSTKSCKKKYIEGQLKGSYCFIVYFKEICKIFLGRDCMQNFEELFFISTKLSSRKTTTKPAKKGKVKQRTNISPDTAETLKESTIFFKKLCP